MAVNTDKIWEVIGMVAVVGFMVTVGVFLWHDKPIRSYYLTLGDTSGAKTCVWADIDWAFDSKAFCTDDVPFAIESVKNLNANR
jgi:hypothetical protein